MNQIATQDRCLPAITRFLRVMIAFAVLALVSSSLSSSAKAQRNPDRPPIEELLPETTVAFLQIADIRDAIEKTSDSAVMQIFQDENVAPLVERFVEEGRSAYGKVEDQVGLSIDEALSLPSGEMVVCMIAPRRKKPAFMFILEVGEDNEAVEKAIGVVDEKMLEAEMDVEDDELESGVKVKKMKFDGMPWWRARRDGLIVGSSSEKELNNFFLRWDGEEVEKARPLSKNRKFVTIMNRCRSEKELPNDVRFFFDPIATYKSFAKGDFEMQAAIAFFPAIGLDTIRAMGGSMILEDEEYEAIVHAHLLLANPRKGITKVVSLKPGDYQPETWMPNDASVYTTTSWDVPQMYQELRGIFDLTLEEGMFDSTINEQFDERVGLSFETDLLSQFSGRISVSQLNVAPGKLNSASWVVGLGLNDANEGKKVGDTLVEWLNENAGLDLESKEYEGVNYWVQSEEAIQERADQRREWREERRRRRFADDEDGDAALRDEQREMMRATVRMPRPTCSIIGGSLVICDSIDAMEKLVATYKGESPSLANDEAFTAMAEKMTNLLGTDMPVALSYSQPKYQVAPFLDYFNADETRSYLSTLAENSEEDGFFKRLKGVADDHDLPTMDLLEKYMLPQGWFVTSDDTGYHMLWFQERLAPREE